METRTGASTLSLMLAPCFGAGSLPVEIGSEPAQGTDTTGTQERWDVGHHRNDLQADPNHHREQSWHAATGERAPTSSPLPPAFQAEISDDWLTLIELPLDAKHPQPRAATGDSITLISNNGLEGPGGGAPGTSIQQPMGWADVAPSRASHPAAAPTGAPSILDFSQSGTNGNPGPIATLANNTSLSGRASGDLDSPHRGATGSQPETRGEIAPLKAPSPSAPPILNTTPSPSGGWIEAARVSGQAGLNESFFTIKYGEHFDTTSTFQFKIVNPVVTTNRPIQWKVWHDDGTIWDTVIESGMGAEFSYSFPDSFNDWAYVTFAEDMNLDGVFDDMTLYSSSFWVQPLKRYVFNVDVSNLVAGADIQSALVTAERLLLKKDSAQDYRACVSFEAGTINSFTPSPARKDPILVDSNTEYQPHWNAASDIVLVSDLPGTILGITESLGAIDAIIIEWSANSALVAEVLAHEIGHGVGLDHNDTNTSNIMHSTALGTFRLTASEADAFD